MNGRMAARGVMHWTQVLSLAEEITVPLVEEVQRRAETLEQDILDMAESETRRLFAERKLDQGEGAINRVAVESRVRKRAFIKVYEVFNEHIAIRLEDDCDE